MKPNLLAAMALLVAAPSAAAQRPPPYPANYPLPPGPPQQPLASRLHGALGLSDNWFVTGSVRLRADSITGQFRPQRPPSDAMISLRAAVLAEYDTGPVRLGAEIIDARGYFQDRASSANTAEVNAIEVTQAYLGFDLETALDDVLGAGTATLTAGRFTLDLGSRRVVARAQFRNSTNAFTGLRLDWRGRGGDSAMVFWTLPHTRLPRDPEGIADNRAVYDRESFDQQFFGASLTRGGILGGTGQIYALGLIERDAPGFETPDRRLATAGVRLFRPPRRGGFDHDVEIIGQFGRTRETAAPADIRDLRVAAHHVHAELGYVFARAWSPRLALQYDLASGDRAGTRSFNRFDPLFGARRWEYGASGLYGPVGRANLNSPALRLEVTPDPRWDAFVAWRPLWLDSQTDSFSFTGVRDRSGASGRFAGHQIEARARHWLRPATVRLDAGVAVLAKGRFLAEAPGAPDTGDTAHGYFDVTVFF